MFCERPHDLICFVADKDAWHYLVATPFFDDFYYDALLLLLQEIVSD